jgi:hypothetical protein
VARYTGFCYLIGDNDFWEPVAAAYDVPTHTYFTLVTTQGGGAYSLLSVNTVTGELLSNLTVAVSIRFYQPPFSRFLLSLLSYSRTHFCSLTTKLFLLWFYIWYLYFFTAILQRNQYILSSSIVCCPLLTVALIDLIV